MSEQHSGAPVGQFTNVDASGEAERLIAFLTRVEQDPASTATRQHSYELLQVRSGHQVVDAGCGGGRAVAELRARGIEAVGIDSSEQMIATARRRFPDADFRAGNVEALAFADGSLQGYRAERLLSHFADPMPVLREARRVLSPGTRLVVVDIETEMWAVDADDRQLVRTMMRALADSVTEPWIGRIIRSRLLDAGFADVEVDFRPTIITQGLPQPLLESLTRPALAAGLVTDEQVEAWIAEQQRRAAEDRFCAIVPTFFATARRP